LTLKTYFLDLGFYSDTVELGPQLQTARALWTLSAYLLLSSGVFCKQCIRFTPPPARFSWTNVELPVLVASFVIGLALFPLWVNWLTKKRRKPSWEHVLWAFSFGFFIDLSTSSIWKRFF
jgi:RsiW-degrading membrane proteinase PrsW (M82 family)